MTEHEQDKYGGIGVEQYSTIFQKSPDGLLVIGSKSERILLANEAARIKHLSGLLPICSNCKKIRDDSGYWHQVEVYLQEHADASLTHGICPQCIEKCYPGIVSDTPGEDQPDDKGEDSTS